MSCNPGQPCGCRSKAVVSDSQAVDHGPSAEDGRRALRDHVLERAQIGRSRFGPVIDADAMMKMMDDRAVVRFPVGVRFDEGGLVPGEFAHAEPLDDHASGGYCLFIHPSLEQRRELLPLVMAYFVPVVNYGDIAESEDCEAFGAALLGMDVEEYYERLCEIADCLPLRGEEGA